MPLETFVQLENIGKDQNIDSNGLCIALSDDKNCQFSDFISYMCEGHDIMHGRSHIYLHTRLDRVIDLEGIVVCCWQDK